VAKIFIGSFKKLMKLRFICINKIDFASNYKSNSKNADMAQQ